MVIHYRPWMVVVALGVGALACSTSATAPTPIDDWGGDFAFSFVDPVGDTLPAQSGEAGAALDVVRLEGTMTASTFTFRLVFATPISAWSTGRDDRLDGFVDFDIDASTTTGSPSAVDLFGGSAAMGTDLFLLLRDDFTGAIPLVSTRNGGSVLVNAVFADSVLIVSIPRSFFGNDDGEMSVAAVIHRADRKATDFLPNMDHFDIRRP